MQKAFIFFVLTLVLSSTKLVAQDTLPNISVKNLGGQIIISWKNNYKKPIATINIQRSYDSTKNFYTIGSVLNPQNEENGYADAKPPYRKMYYRVFIAFDGGSYIITKSKKPLKDLYGDTLSVYNNPWQQTKQQENITHPSKKIFTNRDNNIAIYLPNVETKKITIKFFDDKSNFLFELNKLTEQFYIIEKVNFVHSGWFYFKLYENGVLAEENKFYVLKDGKNQQIPQR
jgi:hypothetical protein